MRLDKFLTNSNVLSRRQAQDEVRKGLIQVDGVTVKDFGYKIDENVNVVTYKGERIEYREFYYVMLNKPQGVVSSTDEKDATTVLDLLPTELQKANLFPCGRLDKDTTGLVILTNDGQNAHRLLSPKHHVVKKYYYECIESLNEEDLSKITNGILLKDGYTTNPCKIEKITDTSGYIYLDEGKYHQIKRMFGAVGNKITLLKRISFGEIVLDENLQEGSFRYLTQKEEKFFKNE